MVLERVAITGASGMVGRHVLDVLESRHLSCVATSRRKPSRLPGNSSWFSWDITQWKSVDELDRLFSGAQALLHLGAIIPQAGRPDSHQELFDANVRATLCLGEWALQRTIPMVYLSSATVYAQPDRAGIKETDETTSRGLGGFYGFTKLLAEKVLRSLAEQGLCLCILRPSSLYGYGLPPDKMISKFLARARQGCEITLTPPVEDSVDLIHATDVAEAMLKALEQQAWGIYNIASGHFASINEIAECCVRTAGKGSVEIEAVRPARPPRQRFGLNCEAARESFGFTPRVSLKDGIRSMWLAMREHEVMK